MRPQCGYPLTHSGSWKATAAGLRMSIGEWSTPAWSHKADEESSTRDSESETAGTGSWCVSGQVMEMPRMECSSLLEESKKPGPGAWVKWVGSDFRIGQHKYVISWNFPASVKQWYRCVTCYPNKLRAFRISGIKPLPPSSLSARFSKLLATIFLSSASYRADNCNSQLPCKDNHTWTRMSKLFSRSLTSGHRSFPFRFLAPYWKILVHGSRTMSTSLLEIHPTLLKMGKGPEIPTR